MFSYLIYIQMEVHFFSFTQTHTHTQTVIFSPLIFPHLLFLRIRNTFHIFDNITSLSTDTILNHHDSL